MAQVVVVTSGKGGVGKTTSSAAFATGLAQRGKKTVVIDFDVGLRNLDLIMGVERRVVFDIVNVISGDAPEEPLYVAHWAILDSARLPFDENPGDEPIELHLDLFSDHPELQTEHISDGVIDDFALPLYYDTVGVSLGLGDPAK